MSGKAGSSKLNDEQGDWFLKNHGARYLRVQTNATIASRKERRARGQRNTHRPLMAVSQRHLEDVQAVNAAVTDAVSEA